MAYIVGKQSKKVCVDCGASTSYEVSTVVGDDEVTETRQLCNDCIEEIILPSTHIGVQLSSKDTRCFKCGNILTDAYVVNVDALGSSSKIIHTRAILGAILCKDCMKISKKEIRTERNANKAMVEKNELQRN